MDEDEASASARSAPGSLLHPIVAATIAPAVVGAPG
jgi:hypothetical protein